MHVLLGTVRLTYGSRNQYNHLQKFWRYSGVVLSLKFMFNGGTTLNISSHLRYWMNIINFNNYTWCGLFFFIAGVAVCCDYTRAKERRLSCYENRQGRNGKVHNKL